MVLVKATLAIDDLDAVTGRLASHPDIVPDEETPGGFAWWGRALIEAEGEPSGRMSRSGLSPPAQPLRSRPFWLSKEGELAEQRVGGGDQPLCRLDSLLSFVRGGCVCRQAGIFQLVPPAPQVRERPETLAKLCPHRAFHRVLTSVGGGAHALLCQQGDAGEPGSVVGQDVRAARIGLDQACSRCCRLLCLHE